MFKLLIVDDNINDRKGLAELVNWRSMGINEVKLAKNGLDGYEKAIEFKPSLIIADISMPVMDGLEMANKVLAELPKMKFIFMSCYDDVDYIRESMDYNAYGYLLKPINIDKLVEKVEKILEIKRDEKAIAENVLRLEQKVSEDVPYVSEMITRDIVYGNIDKKYISQLQDINMDVKKYYSVVVIHLIDVSNEAIGQNCETIHHIKKSMADSIFDNMRISSFLQSRTNLVLMIYLDDAKNEQEGMAELLEYLAKVKKYINTELSQRVIICTAGISSEICGAAEMYNNVEHTLKNNIYEMGNNIVFAEKQTASEALLRYDIMALKQEISEMFSADSFDEIQDFLSTHYDTQTHSKNSVKAFTYTLISILQLYLLEQNESFANVFGDSTSIWTKLSDYNTIVDIRQWIINIFRFVYDYLGEKGRKKDKYTAVIDEIKQIIDEEYGIIENVNQVAERVYTSTSYANHIFKKYEGITMFEYLIHVRMEKAKEMLDNTDMKIYEISEKVGYSSNTYFAALFREHEGMTPKQYRNRK